jgi:AcrR family transcriptional regulator
MTNGEKASTLAENKHQLRTETTRRELLDAAEEVFVRDGFEKARLETIAAAIGGTKGAVYAHFENKEDLFIAGKFDPDLQEGREAAKRMLETCFDLVLLH